MICANYLCPRPIQDAPHSVIGLAGQHPGHGTSSLSCPPTMSAPISTLAYILPLHPPPYIFMTRQYRACGICLLGSKLATPDLGIPASHHLKPHINISPHTSSTPIYMPFRWPCDTECIRSVSAFRVNYTHSCPISTSQPPTTSNHASKQVHTVPLCPPLCPFNGRVVLSACTPYLPPGVKTIHPQLILACQPPTTATNTSTPAYVLPL
jgi:hypothetical protein